MQQPAALDSQQAALAPQQPGQAPALGPGDDSLPRNLWIGELQYWMDENYLWNCFAHTNDLQAVKIIRNKVTGQSEGYGFVEFSTHATAQHVLQTYSGAQMPQTEQLFRLNWASFGGNVQQSRQQDAGPEHSIFVGDLANDVTDYVLTETFRARYQSVKGAKVVIDLASGRSKGYGFVRFASEEERDRALVEMNGQYCNSRPMRISAATPKGTTRVQGGGPRGNQGAPPPPMGEDDPNNTTIFVGGLDASVTEEQLKAIFSGYGELVYVKIPPGKGCGFVQFQSRPPAEAALQGLHGTQLGSQAIRLSWGRNPSAKTRSAYQSQGWQQQQGDQSQYGGYYGAPGAYGAGYDANAYGATDPSAAYGYGGYGYGAGYNYPQQQWPAQQPPASTPSAFQGAPSAPGGGAVAPPATAPFDPSQPPSADKMNAHYMATHETGLIPHHMLLKGADFIAA